MCDMSESRNPILLQNIYCAITITAKYINATTDCEKLNASTGLCHMNADK